MKFSIKKMYKDTVKQLEKHKTEIEIAIAAVAIVALVPEEQDVIEARRNIQERYEDIVQNYRYHILEIRDRLGADLDD